MSFSAIGASINCSTTQKALSLTSPGSSFVHSTSGKSRLHGKSQTKKQDL